MQEFRLISEFPQWVHEYREQQREWPVQYAEQAKALQTKAEELAEKWLKVGRKEFYEAFPDHDEWMGCRRDWYESRPVFCAVQGERPAEWDHIHESHMDFSRGSLSEVQRGGWWAIIGDEFD